MKPESKSIKLAQIIIDPGLQVRLKLNEDAVSDYGDALCDATKEVPPVIVFEIEPGKYLLADGFHRVEGAKRKGLSDILAEVRKGTKADALWFAIGANKENKSVRLTSGDKANAVQLALNKFRDKTQQAIADQVGCSQGRVAQVKAELINVNKLPAPPPHKGKNDKTYPATYKKKAPGATPPSRAAQLSKATPAPVASIVPGALKDRILRDIPAAVLPLWEKADKAAELLEHVSLVRVALKKAQEAGLLEFAEVNFSSALAHLDQAYADIKVVKPYAVCYSCQGKVTEGCPACKGRGYVSEFHWENCVPIEVKQMIAKEIENLKAKEAA